MIITPERYSKAISPEAYIHLIKEYAESGSTSGPNQTESMIHYTRLNAQRMKRLIKTIEIAAPAKASIQSFDTPQTWLILSETWCGDAANSLPVFFKMAELNHNISIRILFRDENLELMDQFLTNGGRSIPKVIALSETNHVLYHWGPRPSEAQTMYLSWKNDPNRVPYDEFQITLQKWYNADAGESIQNEWIELMKKETVI